MLQWQKEGGGKVERFALKLQFPFQGYSWHIPMLWTSGREVGFDVLVPLDAAAVRAVRARYQAREEELQDDPLARSQFEQEVLPQLPWPQGGSIQLEKAAACHRGGLALPEDPDNEDTARLREAYPLLCGGAFVYECHQGTWERPAQTGETVAFCVHRAAEEAVLAQPFFLPCRTVRFLHPKTGRRHTLTITGEEEQRFPWDKGLARRVWTYTVTPPLGQGESLSIQEAHRSGGGAVGFAVENAAEAAVFVSEPYDPASPLRQWEFFLDRLRFPEPPPLWVRTKLEAP